MWLLDPCQWATYTQTFHTVLGSCALDAVAWRPKKLSASETMTDKLILLVKTV